MPKDEFDFDDPLELNGVAFLTEEDTSAEMAECFTEEFLRMGYNHKQVLALFRNPNYVGPNMVLQNKGEPFVREIIAGTFARWGRPVQQWAVPATLSAPLSSAASKEAAPQVAEARPIHPREPDCSCAENATTRGQNVVLDEASTDPLGNPAPKLNL
jgi:hypothetical protein